MWQCKFIVTFVIIFNCHVFFYYFFIRRSNKFAAECNLVKNLEKLVVAI